MLVKLVQVLGRCFLPLRLDILYEELCGYAWRGDKNYPIYILSKYMNEKLHILYLICLIFICYDDNSHISS